MPITQKQTHKTNVCTFCRRRKVRCNRGSPCSSCVKYGNSICDYSPEAVARNTSRSFTRESVFRANPKCFPSSRCDDSGKLQRGNKAPQSSKAHAFSREGNAFSNTVATSGPAASLLHHPNPGNPDTFASSTNMMQSELERVKMQLSSLEEAIKKAELKRNESGFVAFSGSPGIVASPNCSDSSNISTIVTQDSLRNQENLPGPEKLEPIWKNPDSSSVDELSFMIGNNPDISESHYVSFHNSYVPFVATDTASVRHFYPLNWISLIQSDSSVAPLFTMKYSKSEKRRKVVLRATNEDSSNPSKNVFNEKLKDFMNEELTYQPAAKDTSKIEKLKKINSRARAVGLTMYEGDLDSVHSVVTKATLLLPSKRIIWMLIDRFFRRVYPYFSFLDQTIFEKQVTQLLNGSPLVDTSPEDVKIQKIYVSKSIDLVHLGLLLIVLRLSYLSLFTSDDRANELNFAAEESSAEYSSTKILLNSPIDIDVQGMAEQCLFEFGGFGHANIPILQLCLYLNIYTTFSPENGEGADDTNSHGSQVIEMAMSLGLHREPDVFRPKIRDEKTNNLCRKIWWYLIISDMKGSLANGSPLCIKMSQFDTFPPYHKPGNENIRDISLEIQVIHSLSQFQKYYNKLFKAVSMISNVKTPISMREFCKDLSDLEMQFLEIMKNITDPLFSLESHPNVEITNAYSLDVCLQFTFFSASVYHHFFNTYEKMGKIDIAYFFLKKLLTISLYHMMPFHDEFVENGSKIFHHTTDLAVTPSFQTLVHKSTIVLHCVELRARFSIIKMETSPTHQMELQSNSSYQRRYKLLCEIFALCEAFMKIFFKSMKRMSSRYYYCWRYTKAQEILHVIRNGTDYYRVWCRGKETYMSLTDDMLEDLIILLQMSFQRARCYKPDVDESSNLSGQAVGHDPTSLFADSNTELYDHQSDLMWTEMFSMKSNSADDGFYGQNSSFVFPPDCSNGGLDYDPASFIPDINVDSGEFYDEIIRDMMTQNPEF